jgi:hypothetical protein
LASDDLEHVQHYTDPQLRGFSPSEMVACDACLRANAPTRTVCIYCGAQLPVNEATSALRRPTLKPLEEWESGTNVIMLPGAYQNVSDVAMAEASSLTRLEPERLKQLAEAGIPLPLARASSVADAALLAAKLRPLGFHITTVPDQHLSVSSCPARRARTLDWTEDAITFWTTLDNQPETIPFSDLLVLVCGRIFKKRVEVEEQRSGMKRRGAVVESRELVSDEEVLDLFPLYDDGRFGWRIAAESFDYSCLAKRKGLLVRDNFTTLVNILRERAHTAAFNDDYGRVRHLLSAWPLAERTEGQGLRRTSGGKLNTEAVSVVSNEMQFTRYSRLRWRLALRSAGKA